jgi:ABC-type branched-subunit amino acid transport system ATPase component
MTADLLAIEDVRRHFGGVWAVNGASFRVAQGAVTGLIGPNGAGKSTMLSLIAGALRPTSGSIRLSGEEIAGSAAHRNARRGIIRTFQIPTEFSRLTVVENLLVAAPQRRGDGVLGALLGRRSWRSREGDRLVQAFALLEQFDMTHRANHFASELSAGEKRLLEIMRALIARPNLLLLDEPFAGVNPSLTRRIEQHFRSVRAAGVTVLMVEHEMGSVERLCDTVVVMAQGRVIASGTMAEVRRDQRVLDAYLAG